MVSNTVSSEDPWADIQISSQDIEYLHNYLFEHETPLTAHELALVLIHERNRAERAAAEQQQQSMGRVYFPKDTFQVGEALAFHALGWRRGKIAEIREGKNPEVGAFSVLVVDMEDGSQRLFASGLAHHPLNDKPVSVESDGFDADAVLSAHGAEIEQKLEAAFGGDEALTRIAGRWFPRALLVDVSVGNLNLAEAVLDMAVGEPLSASALLKEVALPEGINPKLAEFSLNFALQEDGRFDEVGPAGEVLWCLKRLEPEEVRNVPAHLRYEAMDYDRAALSQQMLALEAELGDELSEVQAKTDAHVKEATISLIYPHLRAGTLPISGRVRAFFPTAYESPHVRFTLVDGKTRQRIPAWVVREHGYVYGLRDWYKSTEVMPGSLIRVRRGDHAGEVVIEARPQRAKDWIRTAIIGNDGGVVFAMLKQSISVEFNDRMMFAIPAFTSIDPLWTGAKRPFEKLVADLIREMSKLTPQGHVHAQELYSAVNIMRRVPPAPLFALLASSEEFAHVGDLHFRLREAE